jgi:hypothetical protein
MLASDVLMLLIVFEKAGPIVPGFVLIGADFYGLRTPGMISLRRWVMSVDLHRRGHGADPLVALVPHLYDNMAGIALCQPVCSNLSRRACCSLYRRVRAVELGALVILHELLPVQDVEIIAGHGTLLRVCSTLPFT